jgi:hypothetical protein
MSELYVTKECAILLLKIHDKFNNSCVPILGMSFQDFRRSDIDV